MKTLLSQHFFTDEGKKAFLRYFFLFLNFTVLHLQSQKNIFIVFMNFFFLSFKFFPFSLVFFSPAFSHAYQLFSFTYTFRFVLINETTCLCQVPFHFILFTLLLRIIFFLLLSVVSYHLTEVIL